MRITAILLFLVLSFNLSGQEDFFTSFGQPNHTYQEACEALVTAEKKVYAISSKHSPGNEFLLVLYQIDPQTGATLDSIALPQETPRTVIGAAGNEEGEIFIVHRHRWNDHRATLYDTRQKTAQHQELSVPEGYVFDKLWSENNRRWTISTKAARQGKGGHLQQFNGLDLRHEFHLFPDDKIRINDLVDLPGSEQLLVGSLRDSAALIWLTADTVSKVKIYGKATDKYNIELQYDAFFKVLQHNAAGVSITGGYLGMGNEVIIDLDQSYQVLRDTVSKGKHPNQVNSLEHLDDGTRFYSLSDSYLSVTDRNQQPVYFYNIRTRAKLPRPKWATNDICLAPEGNVLITAGTTGRPGKDLNFTLTGYSTDLKDTLWHREVGVSGRNTSYDPEGIAAAKDGTIFTLFRTPADAGHHELQLQANDKPSEVLWRVTVVRFPEDVPRDAVLRMDKKGQLLVMAGIPGEEASWLYRYDQSGKLLGKAKTPRTSHFSVKPRLKELKDGRLLATMSVPYLRESYDPLDALKKGYATTDYFSMVPSLLIMTPDGKHNRVDSLALLRKGKVTDVAELKNDELIISGYSQKPLHAGITRYSLTNRRRTWARTLHRPGFEWSRARSVIVSRNMKFYDVLCEYQREKGKDTDLMIYRFDDKNQLVDSLLIEHRNRQLFGAELYQTAKGHLVLRYGLGKPPFDLTNDNHRLRMVLIDGKRLEIQKTKYFDEFQGMTIPYFATPFGKKGHAIMGTMRVDGKSSEDVFLFRLGENLGGK